jgi:hypothetical protein
MASATGTYTGNDATNRTIALAFTPKLVILDAGSNGYLFVSNVNTGTYGHQVPSGSTPQHEAANATRPALTTNGFIVSGTAGSNTNRNAAPYYYFASG